MNDEEEDFGVDLSVYEDRYCDISVANYKRAREEGLIMTSTAIPNSMKTYGCNKEL